MSQLKMLMLIALWLVGGSAASPILSQGTDSFSTSAFSLELDRANGVATRLVALPGDNAGSAEHQFLLETTNRTDNGFNVSTTDDVPYSTCLHLAFLT